MPALWAPLASAPRNGAASLRVLQEPVLAEEARDGFGCPGAARPGVRGLPGGLMSVKTFEPDKYQAPVIEAAAAQEGHIQVNAVAGSGKSTTIEEAAKRAPGRGRIIAFNKSIATAMTDRLQRAGIRHASASTIHAMAYGTVMRHLQADKVDGLKGHRIATELVGKGRDKASLRNLVYRLSSLCKTTLTTPDPEGIELLIQHFDLDVMDLDRDPEVLYDLVPKALEKAKEETKVIDFDDQVWFPIIFDLPLARWDFLFVDESQDLNPVQRELALKTRASQIITVGDSRQAIYGFAGADVHAMNVLREKLDATEMPLSVCYRCPSSHLDLAREIVSNIEARPGAPEGIIDNPSRSTAVRDLKEGDLVVCRTNAPLGELGMELIRKGRKVTIKGRDIGTSLLLLCDRWMGGGTLDDGITQLLQWQERETSKLIKNDREADAQRILDRVDTVIALSDGCRSVADLRERIQDIFDDNPTDGVTLSSVHRAKGLEANRVMIYKPDLLPWPWATPGTWQYEQEMNLRYVALTRAKETLWFVEDKE
jgi:superfamily I DNA/RNA helicase